MGKNIEVFKKRWKTVTNETLSSVRRQLTNFTFDNSIVNKDFRNSCAEWFDGELAPHVWFQQLAEDNAEVAQKFKGYVTGIRFCEQHVSKPSQWAGYVITALTLPGCYYVLDWMTEMGAISKIVFSIGTTVLAWYTCQSFAIKKKNIYEEQVVDLYRKQLDEHFNKILNILE